MQTSPYSDIIFILQTSEATLDWAAGSCWIGQQGPEGGGWPKGQWGCMSEDSRPRAARTDREQPELGPLLVAYRLRNRICFYFFPRAPF